MSVGKIRHFDFYPDEWLAGTIDLDASERGLYITACALIYSHGGSIDRAHLRAACRQDHGLAFNRQLKRLLDLGKLAENDGRITNKRCENEIRKTGERVEKARKNGEKGGRPKELEKPDGSSDEKLTINHQPSTIKEEEDASHPTRARDPAAGFGEWWLEYPHKVGKPVALKSYRTALARASPADLLVGLRRYIANKPSDRNWLNPATFLNQDRWKDEPAPITPQIASSNGKSRHTPAEKLFAGFAAAAGFDSGIDCAADEPLLDRR